MKHLLTQLCTSAIFAAVVPCALAQDASADRIIGSGLQALGQIDKGQTGEIWEDASPTVKARVPKAEWIRTVAESRQKVGAVTERTWASVVRIRQIEDTPALPSGLYANVDFSTRLSDGRTVFELLSFRQESDGRWRLTGYIPRQSQ